MNSTNTQLTDHHYSFAIFALSRNVRQILCRHFFCCKFSWQKKHEILWCCCWCWFCYINFDFRNPWAIPSVLLRSGVSTNTGLWNFICFEQTSSKNSLGISSIHPKNLQKHQVALDCQITERIHLLNEFRRYCFC